jgi:SAM-dependent methyltransferase
MNASYAKADRLLGETFEEVKQRHSPAGHDYIAVHWTRYVRLLMELPPLSSASTVLEIGASILSSVMRRRFGAQVTVIHHELETEWPDNYRGDGIRLFPCELIRDPLPVADNAFDVILFDEVLEHLPVRPEFLLRQILCKLRPGGLLIFSVPNFATSEKRLAFLFGKNPQDHMDPKYVYYAHHREPVMGECLDMVKNCGGKVLSARWTDFEKHETMPAAWVRCARHLYHKNPHPFIHRLFPPTRFYLVIRAARDGTGPAPDAAMAPPLWISGEYAAGRRK